MDIEPQDVMGFTPLPMQPNEIINARGVDIEGNLEEVNDCIVGHKRSKSHDLCVPNGQLYV